MEVTAEKVGRTNWLSCLPLISILNLTSTFCCPSLLHFLLLAVSAPRSLALSSYLQLSEDRMILDAWEKDPHGVRPVVQMRDAGSVQVAGELVDVRLKLGKGCERRSVNIQQQKGTNRKKML